MLAERRLGSKRRWGYIVWGVASLVIAVPEITAAVDRQALPFTTISEMVGHLERYHNWVELLVVGLIVFTIFSVVKVSPRSRSGGARRPGDTQPLRTPGGRLTLRTSASTTPGDDFDDEATPLLFALAALLSSILVAISAWATSQWWDDARDFHTSFVLYGLLGLLWFAVPSILAFARASDVPFPTLFRTVVNLEEWLQSRTWPRSLGPTLGWLVAFVVLWGLVVLMLHLTFYPYPDITHIVDPNG